MIFLLNINYKYHYLQLENAYNENIYDLKISNFY